MSCEKQFVVVAVGCMVLAIRSDHVVNNVCTELTLGGKFYPIRKGTRPRIYTSWRACEKVVNYFSGAEFKRFRMYKEACGFMEGEGVAIVSK